MAKSGERPASARTVRATSRSRKLIGLMISDIVAVDQLRHGHRLVLTEQSADADHANHPVVLGEAEASDSSSSLEELGPGEPGDDRSNQVGVARRFCPAGMDLNFDSDLDLNLPVQTGYLTDPP
jgi:hypothetical protein